MLSVMFKINFAKNLSVLSHVNNALSMFRSLRGRRSKGKGKGISGRDRARGRREEGGWEPFLSPLRAQIPLPLPLVTPATQAMCSANNGLCQC